MKKNEIEANVVLCKCSETHQIFGVRFEKISFEKWKYTWAFSVKETRAKREGYDGTVIKGDIAPDKNYPGCPYCGNKYFIICRCGKLTCYDGKKQWAKCEWCGNTGDLENYAGDGFSSSDDC